VRKSTLRKIERARQKLIASVGALRAYEDDPDAQSLVLLHEQTIDSLTRLPLMVAQRATQADAIILTQAQLRDLLAHFALDVLALQTGGLVRGGRNGS
jgi:hypothetical protein